MYKLLLRPILFCFNPELSHKIVFTSLKLLLLIPGLRWFMSSLYSCKHNKLEKELFGIKFSNPVGLAAGFDKNAELIDDLSCFGFGFIEIGTVTPKAQPGNPRPRLFRLSKDQGLINRMGFNNDGVDEIVKRLKKRSSKVIIGGNIGKNKVTPNDNAIDDYLICFDKLFDHVDYFVVNVSSPNTPGLRELQDKDKLHEILHKLQDNNRLRDNKKPILLKIAPDLSSEQLDDIVEVVIATGLDGVIATNTTISRTGLSTDPKVVDQIGNGGLSGKPLTERSTEVIRYIAGKAEGRFSIMGVGGIFNAQDAKDKLEAGADLVQVYSGFIYEGPGLVKQINRNLITG
ncbi:quinone-dependent dihydroorotate dehydrogenase [bacterium AH-315-C07]|nr:quinone-dependent dihydroorotate dehydrogenase [bacterium AH-315-C07]